MKTIAWVVAFVSLLAGSAQAAPGSYIGKVKNIYVLPNGMVLFHKAGSSTPGSGTASVAPCTTNPNAFVFEGTSDLGKARLTLLMTAWQFAMDMYIVGTGTCGQLQGGAEDLAFFSIHEP